MILMKKGSVLLQPTLNYGNPCEETANPWIGRCNYDAAYELLNHIYGNLTVTHVICVYIEPC